jgi:hypothetical protein
METTEKVQKRKNDKHRSTIAYFKAITKSLELGLLKDVSFDFLIIGLALAYTTSMNFSLLFPYYLQVGML